jgi:uroporphyrinogen-III decarboxylase
MKKIKLQDKIWVEQAKKHLRALYEGEPFRRMPFMFVPYPNVQGKIEENKATVSSSTTTVDEYRRRYYDYELALDKQLKAYEQGISAGFQDDTVLSIGPLSGALGWFVEFFGAENEWFSNRPPFPHPLINKASEIDSLKPEISKGELFRVGLEQMRYFVKEVGDKIPVGTMDLQSPIDLASMLMDYTNLIYLMVDDPEKAHGFLKMITEVLIESLYLMKKEMVSDWPLSQFPWWVPRGVFMSDDLMSTLSPELYAEFGKPYNEIIGREFGGLSLHSCGDIRHNLKNAATTEGLIALNTHETLRTTSKALRDRVVVITGGVREVMAPNYPGSRRDGLKTGEEVGAFWWEDFGHLPEIKGQRYLYQCHALLKTHTPEEAYEKMSSFSTKAASAYNHRKRNR